MASLSPIAPNITLHYLNDSRAHRILWLLEELSLPYKLQIHYRMHNKLAPDTLKAVHPLGKSPVLVVTPASEAGFTNSTAPMASPEPIILAESGNIIEFLVRNYGPQLEPARFPPVSTTGNLANTSTNTVLSETEAYRRYRYLMHFAEGSMMPFYVIDIVLQMLKGPQIPFLVRPISRAIANKVQDAYTNPNIKANLDMLEGFLKSNGTAASQIDGHYFCGNELSGADIMLEHVLTSSKGSLGFTHEAYPALWEYVTRLQARDGYKRANAKAEEAMGKKIDQKL